MIFNMSLKILNRIAQKTTISLLYYSEAGIKPINQIISSDNFEVQKKSNPFVVNNRNLLLPNDGLKDNYTLLGKSIENSPHYELMKCLSGNGNIKSTDYIKRMEKGKIDFRRPIELTESLEGVMIDAFSKKKELIKNDNYSPIKVVAVKGKYYIYDGKHTAALCVLLNKSILCEDITPVIYDSYFKWIYLKMLKKEKDFRKHIEFYKDIWDKNNGV